MTREEYENIDEPNKPSWEDMMSADDDWQIFNIRFVIVVILLCIILPIVTTCNNRNNKSSDNNDSNKIIVEIHNPLLININNPRAIGITPQCGVVQIPIIDTLPHDTIQFLSVGFARIVQNNGVVSFTKIDIPNENNHIGEINRKSAFSSFHNTIFLNGFLNSKSK